MEDPLKEPWDIWSKRVETSDLFETVFQKLEQRVMRMVEYVTASSTASEVYERPNQTYYAHERPFYGETIELHQVQLTVCYYSEIIVPSPHSQTLHRYVEWAPDPGNPVLSRWSSFRDLAAKSGGVTLSDPALVLDTYADDFKRAASPFKVWWDKQVDGAE